MGSLHEGLDEMLSATVALLSADRGNIQLFDPSRGVDTPGSAEGHIGSVRVLVVDDNQDAVESLRLLLELSDCTVAVAYSGNEAIEVARQFLPEVVVCDIGLPGMNGCQVAAAVRTEAALAKSRLIALSGYGQEEDRERSREAGFDAHLTKPVDFAELRRVLQPALGSRPR